jgi:hypothetical protein
MLINADWDPLRTDPRFDKLSVQLARQRSRQRNSKTIGDSFRAGDVTLEKRRSNRLAKLINSNSLPR